jgi:Mg-chelatase subunit ChlI
VNVVEREGVSLDHPARFLLVGTMNPEEGELRPQIADRIGLHVGVEALRRPAARVEVMRRREAFTADPDAFVAGWEGSERELGGRLDQARKLLPLVRVPDDLYGAIARLVLEVGVSSHRADVTALECAKALAALDGREAVGSEDVLAAAALALGHRLAVDPFEPVPELDERLLRRTLEEVLDVEVHEKKAAAPATPGRVS